MLKFFGISHKMDILSCISYDTLYRRHILGLLCSFF